MDKDLFLFEDNDDNDIDNKTNAKSASDDVVKLEEKIKNKIFSIFYTLLKDFEL
jgi:hypothetical protein